MKLIGLISPNLTEDTLVDVYKILPEGIRIEGRALNVGKYTDDEFHRAEQAFSDLVRDLVTRHGARDTTQRGTALAEIDAMQPRHSQHQPGASSARWKKRNARTVGWQ